MLKIKDNVDLKELEKFGFFIDKSNRYIIEKEIIIPCYCYSCECGNTNHSKQETIKTFMIDLDCEIKFITRMSYSGDGSYWRNQFTNEDYDLLYNLIKADLVEKSD